MDFQAHQNNLDSKAKAMIHQINGVIGESICLDDPDVLVTSGSAVMLAGGNKVD